VRLELEAAVRCDGKAIGQIADVVMDPTTRRVTNVVVETHDKLARLVPIDLVGDAGDDAHSVALACSDEELREREPIREFAYLRFDEFPKADEKSDVGVEDVISIPYYESAEFAGYTGELESSVSLTYDRIPKGDVELRRSSEVVAADDERLGHVAGVVVEDAQITHFVLERGHLWRTRDVTIPVDAVRAIETDCVTLKLTKNELVDLPTVKPHFLGF
jgi:sporulation protein YlmC with PRC-barrel domain